MSSLQTVKGFRDFFPEDCAFRDYLFTVWRCVARRYGFVEYEAPLVEFTDLYRKKSGDEITGQLFNFQDKKGREMSLRPEVTPSLARMVTARQRDFRKPMKWFQIGSCFRYEEPQKGRSREFVQLNCDLVGEKAAAADAELIALSIDVMRALGFTEEEFTVRLSDRRVWSDFLEQQKVDASKTAEFLQIIDKLDRVPAALTSEKLAPLGLTLESVRAFMKKPGRPNGVLGEVLENLETRGLGDYVKLDYGIIRGLAYYTGVVFEVFDLKLGLRAIAGGGRYDNLCVQLTDGSVDMPAAGFAMGDVVLGELIKGTARANSALTSFLSKHFALDIYVVVADETFRNEAIQMVQELREEGFEVEYSLSKKKIDKQFQAAEQLQCHMAVIVGNEYPQIQVKNLVTREQKTVSRLDLEEAVYEALALENGILLAPEDDEDYEEQEPAPTNEAAQLA